MADTEEVVEGEIETPDVETTETPVDTGDSQGVVETGESDQQAAEAQTQAEQNYYAAFRNVPQFRGLNDQQIAQQLYQTMQREQAQSRALQQYQQLIPVASEYLTHREQYQKWLSAQQAPAQQQAAAPQEQQNEPWWNPPKLKDSYRQYLVRDAEGREVIAEHAPLDAKAAITDWMAYRADFARKFLDNPEEALGPMVQNIAEKRAAELVEKQITQQRREQFVRDIEQTNAEWLYQNPESRMASAEGLAVQKYIEDVKAMGVADPENRWNLSVAMLERDLALQVIQQMLDQQQGGQQQPQPQPQPAPPPANPAAEQAQKNMEFLRSQAARTAPRSSPATTDPRVPQRPLTFAEKLKAELQSQGMSNLE